MLMPGESLIVASVAGSVLWGRFKTTVLCILKHQRKKKKSSGSLVNLPAREQTLL